MRTDERVYTAIVTPVGATRMEELLCKAFETEQERDDFADVAMQDIRVADVIVGREWLH